jgi:prevent-host-death family protein
MGANDISISELRQNLAEYLRRVKRGETLRVTQHGTVVARIEPEVSPKAAAKRRMAEIRKSVTLGDVISPIDVEWNAAKGILIEAPLRRKPGPRRRRK